MSDLLESQIQETVEQSINGVIGRLMTVTCPCGWKRGITLMYKCLYCDVWFCRSCAEEHFGKSVDEYKQQRTG